MKLLVERLKVVEERGTIWVPMRCFVLSLLWLVKKNTFRHMLTIEVSLAQMTSTPDGRTGDERCIEILSAISGGVQTSRYTGWKRDNKWSRKIEIYFQYSVVEAAADAGINVVPTVQAS